VFDSAEGVKKLDAFFDNPSADSLPLAFVNDHFLALINRFHQDDGSLRWQLVASTAHPRNGEAIADLETQPSSHETGLPRAASEISHTRSASIATLQDFADSEFCERYSCKETQSWALKPRGVNHIFGTKIRTPSDHNLEVEVQTDEDTVSGLGLMFFEKDRLDSDDFKIIESLLRSTAQSRNHGRTMSFVHENIEQSAFQIKEGRSVIDGEFRVWVAKVLQQTVDLERIER
jgi:hypothetical protein